MNKNKEYQEFCVSLNSAEHPKIKERLDDPMIINLLHSSVGLCTEVGEFQDALKKHLWYGKELDMVNLVEELGDILWYVAIGADALGVSFDVLMDVNRAKLEARFKDGFTENAAQVRDLDKEREILEGKNGGN